MSKESLVIKFYELQKKAKLSNKDCAEYLEVTIRSIERWRIERPPAPKAVILAIQAYIDNPKP
jgi:DNA-binding transcriptional regulator YiaG